MFRAGLIGSTLGLSALAFCLGTRSERTGRELAARTSRRTLTIVAAPFTAVLYSSGSGAERMPGGTDVRRVLPCYDRGQLMFPIPIDCGGHPPQVLRQWYGDYQPESIRGDSSAGFYTSLLLLLPFRDLVQHLRIVPDDAASCGATHRRAQPWIQRAAAGLLGLGINNVELQAEIGSATRGTGVTRKRANFRLACRDFSLSPIWILQSKGLSIRESLCGKSQRLFTR